MGRLALLAILALPILEIAVFILIGQRIGVLWTLAGVGLSTLVGILLVRRRGLGLVADSRRAMAEGRLPARALGEASFAAVAGFLLIIPGYVTSALGLLMLLPPVRAWVAHALMSRVTVVTAQPSSRPAPSSKNIELEDDAWRRR